MSTHRLRTPHFKTKAATPAYRDGWEATFGTRTTRWGDGEAIVSEEPHGLCAQCDPHLWNFEISCGCEGCNHLIDGGLVNCPRCHPAASLPDDRPPDPA